METNNNLIVEHIRPQHLKIIKRIENIYKQFLYNIKNKKHIRMKVGRTNCWNNCEFLNENLVFKSETSSTHTKIDYNKISNRNGMHLIMFILSKIVHFYINNITVTRREFYYQLKKYLKSQSQLNRCIQKVSILLNLPPWELGIVGMNKGLVFGNLKINFSNGEKLYCNKSKGILIPPNVNEIVSVETKGEFILIVEKDSIYNDILNDDLLFDKMNSFILITGKGYPDLHTRHFLKYLWRHLNIPIFILVDGDPFGIEIMQTYKFGSLHMSHLANYLAVPQIKWLGVYPSEIQTFNIPFIELSKMDRFKAGKLLEKPFVDNYPSMKQEIQIMLLKNIKAELEGLVRDDFFLSRIYLPFKIGNKDLIY